MELGDWKGVEEVITILKILWSLATRTYHHIHTDKRIRHLFLNKFYLTSEECRVITTVHQLQHLIRTTLKWDVEMWHKRS